MREFLKVLAVLLVIGAAGFYWFASAVSTVEHPDPRSVNQHFQAALERFEDPAPLLTMDAGGIVTTHPRQDRRLVPAAPVDLVVLAWQGPEIGLVEVRLPIWLVGLKGPALRFLLRGTDFDPRRWGITVSDIKDAGPGVVIDQYGARGSRVLVWTE